MSTRQELEKKINALKGVIEKDKALALHQANSGFTYYAGITSAKVNELESVLHNTEAELIFTEDTDSAKKTAAIIAIREAVAQSKTNCKSKSEFTRIFEKDVQYALGEKEYDSPAGVQRVENVLAASNSVYRNTGGKETGLDNAQLLTIAPKLDGAVAQQEIQAGKADNAARLAGATDVMTEALSNRDGKHYTKAEACERLKDPETCAAVESDINKTCSCARTGPHNRFMLREFFEHGPKEYQDMYAQYKELKKTNPELAAADKKLWWEMYDKRNDPAALAKIGETSGLKPAELEAMRRSATAYGQYVDKNSPAQNSAANNPSSTNLTLQNTTPPPSSTFLSGQNLTLANLSNKPAPLFNSGAPQTNYQIIDGKMVPTPVTQVETYQLGPKDYAIITPRATTSEQGKALVTELHNKVGGDTLNVRFVDGSTSGNEVIGIRERGQYNATQQSLQGIPAGGNALLYAKAPAGSVNPADLQTSQKYQANLAATNVPAL